MATNILNNLFSHDKKIHKDERRVENDEKNVLLGDFFKSKKPISLSTVNSTKIEPVKNSTIKKEEKNNINTEIQHFSEEKEYLSLPIANKLDSSNDILNQEEKNIKNNHERKKDLSDIEPLKDIKLIEKKVPGKQRLAAVQHNFITFLFVYCDATA